MKWKDPEHIFFGDRSKSVLNLIWHTTPRSDVNWLSGIPPAPTIHYAETYLKDIWEGYSEDVSYSSVAGTAISLYS